MRTVDLITKKRDGEELSGAYIEWFVRGFTAGNIPDYQAATVAMANSGERLNLSTAVSNNTVDKHATGGVEDKTTLVVAPTVHACGAPVGKMSGRRAGPRWWHVGQMLYLARKVGNASDGSELARTALEEGSALRQFRTLVSAQDGDPSYIDHPEYSFSQRVHSSLRHHYLFQDMLA